MTRLVLARFKTAHETLEAARAAARGRCPAQDALLPHPIEGISDYLAPAPEGSPVGWVMVVAGISGAVIGYGMQWYSDVIDYPILSGGRPLNSWPVFVLVPYEMAILLAGICGLLGWLWYCGLPKLHQPLFALAVVEHAVQDEYFLLFRAGAGVESWLTTHVPPAAIHEFAP